MQTSMNLKPVLAVLNLKPYPATGHKLNSGSLFATSKNKQRLKDKKNVKEMVCRNLTGVPDKWVSVIGCIQSFVLECFYSSQCIHRIVLKLVYAKELPIEIRSLSHRRWATAWGRWNVGHFRASDFHWKEIHHTQFFIEEKIKHSINQSGWFLAMFSDFRSSKLTECTSVAAELDKFDSIRFNVCRCKITSCPHFVISTSRSIFLHFCFTHYKCKWKTREIRIIFFILP